jgi:hypothetical protein
MCIESEAGMFSTSIPELLVPTGSKAVALTVITLVASNDLIVAIQLPAYIGLLNVSSDSTDIMSEIC